MKCLIVFMHTPLPNRCITVLREWPEHNKLLIVILTNEGEHDLNSVEEL